jgi:hypothetical protein
MARDIGRLEVLGPNPDAMPEFMRQSMRKADTGQSGDKQRSAINALDRTYAELTGLASISIESTRSRSPSKGSVTRSPSRSLVRRPWVSISLFYRVFPGTLL